MDFLLTILQVLFSALTMGLAIFGLLTENFEYQNLMLLSMGLMILVMGIRELRKEKKAFAYFIMLAAAFILYVSIEGFLLN